MANLLTRTIAPMKQMSKYAATSFNALRYKSDSKAPTTGGDNKIEKKTLAPQEDPKTAYFADPWDILYGAERYEIAMKNKGFDDPYDMEPKIMNKNSTKENPNIVYTLKDTRIVGCICEEDTHHINYMQIFKGETKRCECGHWFTLKERPLPDLSEYGINLSKEHH